MNLCGEFSAPDAIRSIAIGDLLFSFSSILVHILEASDSKNASSQIFMPAPTGHFSVLGIHVQFDENYTKEATEALCWIYFGINLANILLAILVWQAVVKGCILKCMSYLVISPFLITIGLSTVVFHAVVVGRYPHYYALVMYPCYWTYKIFSLWVVNRFLNELRESSLKTRNGYSSIDDGIDAGDVNNIVGDIREGYHYQNEAVSGKLELKLPKKYEISEDRLQLDHKTCLEYEELVAIIKGLLNVDSNSSKDKGNFTDVAVKTLKVTTPTIPFGNALLQEAKLLVHIGPHDHVLKFYGVCTIMRPKEKLFLIMDYYPKGKLDTFLRDCVDTYGGRTFKDLLNIDGRIEVSPEKTAYENWPISKSEFTTMDMVQWAYQIASAMEHLHTKRVIYGCLQAKCIALIKTNVVKLTGFTFSAKLYSSNRTVQRENLPSRVGRWTALECLGSTDKVSFTTRSDVWSFGVTLWEIFSLGEVPYGDWNSDIVRSLINGMRLEKPRYSPCQIFEIMGTCWRRDATDRPNFYLLKLFFQQLLSSLTKS